MFHPTLELRAQWLSSFRFEARAPSNCLFIKNGAIRTRPLFAPLFMPCRELQRRRQLGHDVPEQLLVRISATHHDADPAGITGNDGADYL